MFLQELHTHGLNNKDSAFRQLEQQQKKLTKSTKNMSINWKGRILTGQIWFSINHCKVMCVSTKKG